MTMKLVVKEHINAITELDPINPYGMIPMNIGLMKGDLIVFAAEGDPRRFPAGTASGKVMITDPTAELGWVLADPDVNAARLLNKAGTFVQAGRPVCLNFNTYTGDCRFALAAVNSETPIFIAGEDSMDGEYATCYASVGSIANVMMDTHALTRGQLTAVTELGYGGPASSASKNIIGYALEPKASGSTGLVPVLLIGTGGVNVSMDDGGDQPEPQSIIKSFSANTITPESGYVYRSSVASHPSLTVNLPASPAEDYIFEVDFTSGSSFSQVTFMRNGAGYTVKLAGDGLNKKGKRYCLIVWWDGLYFWCACKAQ